MRSLLLIIVLIEVYIVAPCNVNAGTITGDVKFVDSPPKLAPSKLQRDKG